MRTMYSVPAATQATTSWDHEDYKRRACQGGKTDESTKITTPATLKATQHSAQQQGLYASTCWGDQRTPQSVGVSGTAAITIRQRD